jgi:hypothetical protein
MFHGPARTTLDLLTVIVESGNKHHKPTKSKPIKGHTWLYSYAVQRQKSLVDFYCCSFTVGKQWVSDIPCIRDILASITSPL